MENKTKINDFTDLIVWQKAHQLVLIVYKITSGFPRTEQYALTDQLRRAVVSVISNIAEGFSRHTLKEKIQFYYMAVGSLTEIRNQFIIASDLDYVKREEFENIVRSMTEISKMMQGLIKSLKR